MIDMGLEDTSAAEYCPACGHAVAWGSASVITPEGLYHWTCYMKVRFPKDTDKITCPDCGNTFMVSEGATITIRYEGNDDD